MKYYLDKTVLLQQFREDIERDPGLFIATTLVNLANTLTLFG